jgi:DNA-binding MarR family transcriptional regulator
MKKQPMVKKGELSLEETLFAFRRKLSDALRQEAEGLGYPLTHIDTLSYIAEKGDPTMKEVANHLHITPPSTTALIEVMQKKKLVIRIAHESDRRTIRVMLTAKAWKFFKVLHERKFTIFTKMSSKLRETERKEFIRILNILIKE